MLIFVVTPQRAPFMKKFILSLLLLNNLSYGSGKITVEPRYFLDSGNVGYMVGFGVYESLFAGINYNMWTGIGTNNQSTFFHSRNDLEKHFGRLCVGVGISLNDSSGNIELLDGNTNAHLRISYKFW